MIPMGWIRKILLISGGLILLFTFITMLSQVYTEGLGWDGIDQNLYIFLYIIGGALIGSMFVYDLVSFILLRSDVHQILDESERITPLEISRMLDEPLWRVLPIFRKRFEPGILISLSGKYMHFNETFQEQFLEEYSKGIHTIGELAHNFALSKKEINLIIDELDYKGVLPDVKAPLERHAKEISTKGLRKTVRRRKKLKKK